MPYPVAAVRGKSGSSNAAPSPPVADFTGTPLTGVAPLSVAFTDASANTPTSWSWEKNDGSGWVNFAGTPTAQNPTESFAVGIWSVRLTATNTGGSDTKTRSNYVVTTAAVYLRDTFTDADGTNLTTHTMDVGSGWTVNAGTWTILGNELLKALTPNTHQTCSADAGVADAVVSADLTIPVAGGYTGLSLRLADNNNGWYAELDEVGQMINLLEVVAGGFTLRAAVGLTLARGSTYTLTATCVGPSITLAVGATMCNYGSANTQLNTSRFGFRCYTGGSNIDNFKVTAA